MVVHHSLVSTVPGAKLARAACGKYENAQCVRTRAPCSSGCQATRARRTAHPNMVNPATISNKIMPFSPRFGPEPVTGNCPGAAVALGCGGSGRGVCVGQTVCVGSIGGGGMAVAVLVAVAVLRLRCGVGWRLR